jgi:hypothetical protein
MTKLSDIPCWYYGIVVVLSGYQAHRGFMFQWIAAKVASTVRYQSFPDWKKRVFYFDMSEYIRKH